MSCGTQYHFVNFSLSIERTATTLSNQLIPNIIALKIISPQYYCPEKNISPILFIALKIYLPHKIHERRTWSK